MLNRETELHPKNDICSWIQHKQSLDIELKCNDIWDFYIQPMRPQEDSWNEKWPFWKFPAFILIISWKGFPRTDYNSYKILEGFEFMEKGTKLCIQDQTYGLKLRKGLIESNEPEPPKLSHEWHQCSSSPKLK